MRNSEDINYAKAIGEKLRTIRKSKKITLNDISKQTGLTASFISQFERGLTTSSIASMQKIAQVLQTPLASLFDQDDVDYHPINNISLVRKQQRREMLYPAPAKTKDYFLTNLEGKLQVIYSSTKPGGNSGEQYSHESEEECVLILAGIMEIKIDDQTFVLNEGDTLKFTSRSPHGWKNIGEDELEVLWIITPPSF